MNSKKPRAKQPGQTQNNKAHYSGFIRQTTAAKS